MNSEQSPDVESFSVSGRHAVMGTSCKKQLN